jgi:membrane protease YdiL (CAAX protease family)
MRMQARYLVGAARLELPGLTAEQAYQQAQRLNAGPYGQRLRFVVLAGELAGSAEALDVLARLEPTEDAHARVASLLHRLYAGYEKGQTTPALSEAEQEELTERLGWFGELALAPEGGDADARRRALAPARRTVFVALTATVVLLAGLAVGGFLLTLLALLASAGRLRGGLLPGTGHGGIYAETFALYLLVYLAFGWLLRFVPRGEWDLSLNIVAMFGSLIVLAWPRLGGVPWPEIRRDIGLHGGDRPGVEMLVGLGTYVCAIPAALAGLLVTLALMRLQQRLGAAGAPSHPIVNVALSDNPWVWLQVFLVACVAAPVVEEVMFRGVLYRHLREASGSWRPGWSVAGSAAATGFVFAVIHPQGWLGVPVLMGLAVVFALAREWRRTLLPATVAHGLNNGLATLLLLTTAG